MDKIYSTEDIEKAKISPSFEREYNLQYTGHIGNIFSLVDIEDAIELGEKYRDLSINSGCLHGVGIDPGFSSSVTAITVVEIDTENQIVRVVLSEEHDKREMQYDFVNHTDRTGHQTKKIVRGWPACIFCSAKDESKWEIWPENRRRDSSNVS